MDILLPAKEAFFSLLEQFFLPAKIFPFTLAYFCKSVKNISISEHIFSCWLKVKNICAKKDEDIPGKYLWQGSKNICLAWVLTRSVSWQMKKLQYLFQCFLLVRLYSQWYNSGFKFLSLSSKLCFKRQLFPSCVLWKQLEQQLMILGNLDSKAISRKLMLIFRVTS